MKFKLSLLTAIVYLVEIVLGNSWDYERHGPDTWFINHPSCAGLKQSPVNIELSQTRFDNELRDLNMNAYNRDLKWQVALTEHNLQLNPFEPFINITGSNFEERFYLSNIHFHWGHNSYQGSEHRFDNKKMPLEMHFLHESNRNEMKSVLGFLFKISETNNSKLNPLIEAIQSLNKDRRYVNINLNIMSILPSNIQQYFRYSGSLTTPPCSELAIWTIFYAPIEISSKQLAAFRGTGNEYCFRDPQDLNGRLIFSSFKINRNNSNNQANNRASRPISTYLLIIHFLLHLTCLNKRF